MNVPYWVSPYPFNDFVTMTYKKSSVHPDKISFLKKKCEQIGVQHFIRRNLGKQIFFSATSFPLNENQNAVLSGVAQRNGKFYLGQNDMNTKTENDFGESIGIFTLIVYGTI